MKFFLYKLRTDLKRLFLDPEIKFGKDMMVNYDVYWHKRGRTEEVELSPWQKERADIAKRYIDTNDVIVDLGCGDGGVLAYLKEDKQITGIGVDSNQMILDYAKQFGIETILLDITDPDALEALPERDVVTGFEIFEHVSLPEQLIGRLKKKTRKAIIFSVPNTGYYAHRLRLLLGRFPLQWVTHPGEHLRYWTYRDMRGWLDAQGFPQAKIIVYQGLPLLKRLMPSLFGQAFVVYIPMK